MNGMIEFFVDGKPQPAGSKRAFAIRKGGQLTGRVAVMDANPKSKDWKTDVKFAARSVAEEMQGNLLACPIRLTLAFTIKRPKSHYRTGKNSHLLKADAPHFPTSKPDVLKLARGVEDALTSIIWVDDAQIADEHLSKVYGEKEGCKVIVEELKRKCPHCEKGEYEEDHPCPFKDEIHDDRETLCNCCAECRYQCQMDI